MRAAPMLSIFDPPAARPTTAPAPTAQPGVDAPAIADALALLRAGLDGLAPSDRDFAESLLNSAAGRGLTEKQAAWVQRLSRKLTKPAAQVGDVAGIVALLDKAATNLKRPRIMAQAGEIAIRLTIAGPTSRTPGAVMVTGAKAGQDGMRAFYGRISRTGQFEAGRDLAPQHEPAMVAALVELATDPAKAALKFGRLTGTCCFCTLPLQNAASVSAGYGPICAEKYGLPWGEVTEFHTHA